jgi:hypothetical protein
VHLKNVLFLNKILFFLKKNVNPSNCKGIFIKKKNKKIILFHLKNVIGRIPMIKFTHGPKGRE